MAEKNGEESFSTVRWSELESFTSDIIWLIFPTVESEIKRKAVVDYVQKLMGSLLGAKVAALGSVPFKTYLSDGDIDLTVFSTNMEKLASNVHTILQREEKNEAAELDVRDVQCINAEVPLVKCIIQNIVVDISFNQVGGLQKLYFLEKVNNFIGKNHLFKRCVLLIKAWCYYESRILGSTHGLLSTYALEILILHIFHRFHSKLTGPLSVFYTFLDYFSKFNWNLYCISLLGPVHVSSLPNIIVEPPGKDDDNLLFPVEFLEEFINHSMDSLENKNRLFTKKYLNIIDPLKNYNNLGRSVSKGNLFRIQSAFQYGAEQLQKTLQSSAEVIVYNFRMFFANITERHENGKRADVQYKPDLQSRFGVRGLNLVKRNAQELEVRSRFSDNFPVQSQLYEHSNISANEPQLRVEESQLYEHSNVSANGPQLRVDVSANGPQFIGRRSNPPETTAAHTSEHGEDTIEDRSQPQIIPLNVYNNGLASPPTVFDLEQQHKKFPYYSRIPCWDNESPRFSPLQRQTVSEYSGARDPMDQDYHIDHGQRSKNHNLRIIVPERNYSMPFLRSSPRDALQQWNNMDPHRNRLTPSPSSPFSPINFVLYRNGIIPTRSFSPDGNYDPYLRQGFNGWEGSPKSRESGTYTPIKRSQKQQLYKDTQLRGRRGRSPLQGVEDKVTEKRECESLKEVLNTTGRKSSSPRPVQIDAPERQLQFGSLGPVSVPLPGGIALKSSVGSTHGSHNKSTICPAVSSSPKSMEDSTVGKETRTSSNTSAKPKTSSLQLSRQYKLKDKDFPPLNVSGISVNVEQNLENTAWGKSTMS